MFYAGIHCSNSRCSGLLSNTLSLDRDSTATVSDSVKYFSGNKWYLLCIPLFIRSTTKSWSCNNTAITLFWDKVEPSLSRYISMKECYGNRPQDFSCVDCNRLSVGAIHFTSVELKMVLTTGKIARAISRSVTNGFLSELPPNAIFVYQSLDKRSKGWNNLHSIVEKHRSGFSEDICLVRQNVIALNVMLWNVMLGNNEKVGKTRYWWSELLSVTK